MKYVFKKKRNKILVGLLDALGGAITGLLPSGAALDHRSHFKTILVVRLDHIGDVLPALAVPKILKESFPKSRVIFLASSVTAPLLENNPFVDKVLVYDAPWFSKSRYYSGHSKSPGFFKIVSTLRSLKIDLGLSLRGDLRENAMLFMASVRHRIGYGITGGGFFLTKELKRQTGVHQSEHTLSILGSLGMKVSALEPNIYFAHGEQTAFKTKFESAGLDFTKPIIAIQINAGTSAKEWPVSYLLQTIVNITRQWPEYSVALVGSDFKRSREIQTDRLPAGVFDLVGRTSLRELCFLLKSSRAVVGPDSGPAHIAAALGVPTVFLYSGTNVLEEWKPLADNAQILNHKVSCSPCHLTLCNIEGHPCMSEIKPEQVLDALKKVL